MRAIRAAWLGLNTVGFGLSFTAIILGLVASCGGVWMVYTVPKQTGVYEFIQVSRSRSLWSECTDLDGDLRRTVPGIFLSTLSLAMITVLGLVTFGLLLRLKPFQWHTRASQYMALIGGFLLWFWASLFVLGVVIFLHDLTMENYINDPWFLSLRSSWPPRIRNETKMKMHGGIPIALSAYGVMLCSATCFGAASLLF